MIVRSIAIGGAVLAAVKVATIVDRVIWSSKCIARIVINDTTVSIVRVVDVGDTVVVVIPVNVVFETVSVDIGID